MNERYRGRVKKGLCLLVKEELDRNVNKRREVLLRLMFVDGFRADNNVLLLGSGRYC